MALIELAKKYRALGLSVIPIKRDGSKSPDLRTWKEYQTRLVTDEEITRFFSDGSGIGVIAGEISGGLEILDFEMDAPFDEWLSIIQDHDAELVNHLVIIGTPTGGHHVPFRSPGNIEENQKLARRPDRKVLIETRGERGYALTVGCPPDCHPSGKLYTYQQGRWRNIPALTADQRGLFLDAARSFNEYQDNNSRDTLATAASSAKGGRPGDLFNERECWTGILGPHGWTNLGQHGDTTYWRRPGKDFGLSATTNYKSSDLLYVFSTNATPFEAERSYDKFGAYTLLEHRGNFKAAVLAIAQKYGMASEDEEAAINGVVREATEEDKKQAAENLVERIEELCQLLAQHPQLGRRREELAAGDLVARCADPRNDT